MNVIQRIDKIIEERSLLKHPFYEMWSDGKLTQESLAGYSKEYFQLVKAVPEFMAPIIEKAPDSVVSELVDNQQEESDHIKPWISFAGELGISEDELISYSGLVLCVDNRRFKSNIKCIKYLNIEEYTKNAKDIKFAIRNAYARRS